MKDTQQEQINKELQQELLDLLKQLTEKTEALKAQISSINEAINNVYQKDKDIVQP